MNWHFETENTDGAMNYSIWKGNLNFTSGSNIVLRNFPPLSYQLYCFTSYILYWFRSAGKYGDMGTCSQQVLTKFLFFAAFNSTLNQKNSWILWIWDIVPTKFLSLLTLPKIHRYLMVRHFLQRSSGKVIKR